MNKKITKVLFTLGAAFIVSCGVTMNDVLEAAEEYGSTASQGLSQEKAASGLKQALEVGIKNAAAATSKTDGFFKNPAIKIPFPPEVKEVEAKLRQIGLGSKVDQFVLSLNRSAELAAKEAAPIFINAIKSMSISDALGILKGSNNAATQYLEGKTRAALMSKFMPVIKKSLDKAKVNTYWSPLATAYNALPLQNDVNPDLNDFVANRAVDGLFLMLSKEEQKIRENPAARVTDLLKEVFGYKF